LQNACNSKQKEKRLTPILIVKIAQYLEPHVYGIKPQALNGTLLQ